MYALAGLLSCHWVCPFELKLQDKHCFQGFFLFPLTMTSLAFRWTLLENYIHSSYQLRYSGHILWLAVEYYGLLLLMRYDGNSFNLAQRPISLVRMGIWSGNSSNLNCFIVKVVIDHEYSSLNSKSFPDHQNSVMTYFDWSEMSNGDENSFFIGQRWDDCSLFTEFNSISKIFVSQVNQKCM